MPVGDGLVEFRVWAPNAQTRDVGSTAGSTRSSPKATASSSSRSRRARRARYSFALDDGPPLPDPCSRWQPDGVRGPSEVLDHAAFEWTDEEWAGVPLEDLVIYELHVGTFTRRGNLRRARSRTCPSCATSA